MKRRKDGRYQKQVRVNHNGQNYFRWVYGRTQAEVKQKEEAFREEIARMDDPTLDELIKQYNEHSKLVFTTSTYYLYRSGANRFKKFINDENRKASDITSKDIYEFMEYCAEKGLSHNTIRIYRAILKSIFDYATVHYDIPNPCTGVQQTASLGREEKVVHPLTEKEIEIVKQSEDCTFGSFAYVLLYTGLRRGELLALKYEDVYDQKIHVHATAVQAKGRNLYQEHPKTKNSVRRVPVLDPVKKYLEVDSKTGYIFGKSANELISHNQFNQLWKQYLNETGLDITPHQLRHTFATLCYKNHIDPLICSQWLGHSSPNITLSVYTELDAKTREKEALKFTKF